jgi:small subunit ribosomal protein S14
MGIMKVLLLKDKIKRSNISIFEERQKTLKFLKKNKNLQIKWWSKHKLANLLFKKFNNRCIFTGRSKSVNKTFKLSRLELRRWANLKILPGLGKASW